MQSILYWYMVKPPKLKKKIIEQQNDLRTEDLF